MACMSPTSELPRLHCEQPYGRPRRRMLFSKRVWTKIKRGPGKGRIYHKLLRSLFIVDSFSDIHVEPKGNL